MLLTVITLLISAFTSSTSPVHWRVLKDKLAYIIQQPQNLFSQENKRNLHSSYSFRHCNWSACSGYADADKWCKEQCHTEGFSLTGTYTFGDDLGHCLATGPQRVLQRGPNSASCFSIRYILVLLMSSSSCLRSFSRLPVTFILSSIFPSKTCFISQFLHTLWPIQLAFLLLIVCRILFSSLTMCNTSSFLTWSVRLTFHSLSSITFQTI